MLRILPVISPKELRAIYSGNHTLRKRNIHTFKGLLNIGSKFTLIPGNLKHHRGSPYWNGDYEVITEALAQGWFTCILTPISKHVIGS